MKIVNIVGARPQFIKCACVSRVIRQRSGVEEVIIHTGQHYDRNMSDIFFSELEIPEPDINLGVGSGTHAVQTAEILTAIEKSLITRKPDWVIVYGDTNSTLAAAVAASKLNLQIAHVEAGLRSFNRAMPEEINRIVTDHVADLLLAPTQTALDLLEGEGLASKSLLTGDVMYDSVLHSRKLAKAKFGHYSKLKDPGLQSFLESSIDGKFYLATVHRQENTDHPERLAGIFQAFDSLNHPFILPLHPLTKKMVADAKPGENIRIIEPVGYLEMLTLLDGCEKVLTDSGGLQKEAYFMDRQCITLRDETEWTETLNDGWNTIVSTDTEKILAAVNSQPTAERGDYFGNGKAAEAIVNALMK